MAKNEKTFISCVLLLYKKTITLQLMEHLSKTTVMLTTYPHTLTRPEPKASEPPAAARIVPEKAEPEEITAELEELPAEDDIAELEPADDNSAEKMPPEQKEETGEDEKLAKEFSVSSLNFSFLDDENKSEEKNGEEN